MSSLLDILQKKSPPPTTEMPASTAASAESHMQTVELRLAIDTGSLPRTRFESYLKLKAEQAAKVPKPRRPSVVANAPGWRRRSEGAQPFRHRQYREDD